MRLYGKKSYLKKKLSYGSQKNSEKYISKLNIKLIHQIFDTINISFIVLIFTLFFYLWIAKGNGQIHTKPYLKQELSIIISLIIFLKLRNFILANLNLLILIKKLNPKI